MLASRIRSAPGSLTLPLPPAGDQNEFSSFPTADLEDVGELEGDLGPLAPPSEELTSPALSSDTGSPLHPSPFQAPAYAPEDLPPPPDFELRESGVASSGLGVWALRRVERGERLGPGEGGPRAPPREQTHGWEVGCRNAAGAEGGWGVSEWLDVQCDRIDQDSVLLWWPHMKAVCESPSEIVFVVPVGCHFFS